MTLMESLERIDVWSYSRVEHCRVCERFLRKASHEARKEFKNDADGLESALNLIEAIGLDLDSKRQALLMELV